MIRIEDGRAPTTTRIPRGAGRRYWKSRASDELQRRWQGQAKTEGFVRSGPGDESAMTVLCTCMHHGSCQHRTDRDEEIREYVSDSMSENIAPRLWGRFDTPSSVLAARANRDWRSGEVISQLFRCRILTDFSRRRRWVRVNLGSDAGCCRRR
jgi:hypothetical protein